MADDDAQRQTRSAADKERSRQQSRQVSGREAARTPNQTARKAGGRPGNTRGSQQQQGANRSARTGGRAPQGQRPANGRRAGGGQRPGGGQRGQRPARGPGRGRPGAGGRPTTLLTWGIVGLVLVIVAVLVIVKVTSSSSPSSGPTGFQAAPASLVQEVTHIPASVYNAVGVSSSDTPVTPPTAIKNQPSLRFPGSTKPGVFYFGAEYCPFCAAERWALIATVSRFGSLSNLGLMASSSTDVYPSTQTFTFAKAKYSSSYIDFVPDEYESNQLNSAGTAYEILENLTPQETKLVDTYDSSKYVPSATEGQHPFPFIDFDNKYLVSGASYSPALLQGLNRNEIASGLTDAKNPVTEAIVASANYMSAAVCGIDGQQPSSVCSSKGVTEAAKALSK